MISLRDGYEEVENRMKANLRDGCRKGALITVVALNIKVYLKDMDK